MDIILSSVRWQFAVVYLDDIEIVWKMPLKHINHTPLDLSLLTVACVTLQLKSAHFSRTRAIILVTLSVQVDLKSLTIHLSLYLTRKCQQYNPIWDHSFLCAMYSAGFSRTFSALRPHWLQVWASRTKRAWTIQWRKINRFADFTEETYLFSNIDIIQESRTIHLWYGCMLSSNSVCPATKSRRGCRQTNSILVRHLERLTTEPRHYSSKVPCSRLGNLAPEYVPEKYRNHGLIQASCAKVDSQLGEFSWQTHRMPSLSYTVRLWHSAPACCQTPGHWRISATFHKEYGRF